MSLILTDQSDTIGTIRLNHQEKRNALSSKLIDF
jgi:enoyl-CoA hydratase/carnithine racemase